MCTLNPDSRIWNIYALWGGCLIYAWKTSYKQYKTSNAHTINPSVNFIQTETENKTTSTMFQKNIC